MFKITGTLDWDGPKSIHLKRRTSKFNAKTPQVTFLSSSLVEKEEVKKCKMQKLRFAGKSTVDI